MKTYQYHALCFQMNMVGLAVLIGGFGGAFPLIMIALYNGILAAAYCNKENTEANNA